MHPIERIELAPLQRLTSSLEQLVRGRLWLQVLVGLVLGVTVGSALGPSAGFVSREVAEPIVAWVALPGRLFLALIQMVVVPLVFASIIRGLGAGETMAQLRRMGSRAGAYFLATSAVSIGLGVAIALVVRPGRFVAAPSAQAPVVPEAAHLPGWSGLPEALVGILPTNPLASMVSGEMLQVILFALFVGVALVSIPEDRSAPLFDLLGSLQEICMTVVRWAMRLAPLAVFGLIAQLASQVGFDVLVGLAGYVLCVLAGLLGLLVGYVLLAWLVGRRPPLEFLRDVRALQLLAFSTSSSAAVMPLSMETAQEQLGVRPSVAGFMIPLGATINMDGTALYQGVATVFLAQVFGVPLDASAIVLLVVTATAASIGSPATPGVGIVILATVLAAAGVPASGVALILGVDRLVDMCRTAVNVTGDMTAALVVDRWLQGYEPVEMPSATPAESSGESMSGKTSSAMTGAAR